MVLTGLERLLESTDQYNGRNAALIVNQTSVTADLKYSWNALRQKGLRVTRLFSPEHGLFGAEQDQISVKDRTASGVEVVSLYGSSPEALSPDAESLRDIDLIIFDIQDIGTRYYTFAGTMALFMGAAAKSGIEFIVLDRPNPIGGVHVEGPDIRNGFESFVGILPVPVRHGMTVGELALLYRDISAQGINLKIMTMKGWEREMMFSRTGLPWIPPSPNMPSIETALVYPGMCLVEGVNMSEGRGTTTPFMLTGAPYIQPDEMTDRLNSMALKGVRFRPIFLKPTFHKYSGETIGGIYLHITDTDSFLPFLTGVSVIKTASDLYREFSFLRGVYEFNDLHPAFDLLAGSPEIREAIIRGDGIDDIRAIWSGYETEFIRERKKYLLY
jgi:uncharacterized protein YbbC (DUF1343 family)